MDGCYASTYLRICNADLRPTELIRAGLGNERRGGCRVVFECRWDLLLCLVVAGKAMNTRLDQDQTELGVLVFPVGLEVLTNGNSLLHEMP